LSYELLPDASVIVLRCLASSASSQAFLIGKLLPKSIRS
jgi:hypothetical protein